MSKVITVYVRKEGERTRTLSFARIPGISDRAVLDRHYAIDGKTIRRTVDTQNLCRVQQGLWEWLTEEGYTIEFD